MSDIEYSDGIEQQTQLKYEKTQNRDLMKTIERINRSEKFKDSAEKVVSLLGDVMVKDAPKIFKEAWRNNHESHSNPEGMFMEVNMGSPIYKKVHEDGDTSDRFLPNKEYPFYYSMGLNFSFSINTPENITSDSEKIKFQSWFNETIYPYFNKKILEKSKVALDSFFNNIFAFPSIEKKDDVPNSVIGKKPITDRINVSSSVSVKFNTKDSITTDVIPFNDSSDLRVGIVSNIALAFERIVRV